MTIKELRKVTKAPIYVERDDDGATMRREYTGSVQDYQISKLQICHIRNVGFVLCVELEDMGA